MRATLLGTGQLHPAERVQCGILIEDDPILIDSGAGVYQRLYESQTDVDELEHIMFTHLHQDHVNDIVPIVSAKRHADDRPLPDDRGRRSAVSDGPSQLTIYGPLGTKSFVQSLVGAFRKNSDEDSDQVEPPFRNDQIDLSVEEIAPGSTSSVQGRTVETIETRHGGHDEASLAYKFDGELAVTGDTAAIDSVADFVDGVHVLIHECTFFDGRDSSGHTTPRELALQLEGRDIDEVYLTHLPAHTPRERREVIATIRDRFNGNVTIARDMDRISTGQEN